MGLKAKLPLLKSKSRIVRWFGYIIYAFLALIVMGVILPSPDVNDSVSSTPPKDEIDCNECEEDLERARSIYWQNGYHQLTTSQQKLIDSCGTGRENDYAFPESEDETPITVEEITRSDIPITKSSDKILEATATGEYDQSYITKTPDTSNQSGIFETPYGEVSFLTDPYRLIVVDEKIFGGGNMFRMSLATSEIVPYWGWIDIYKLTNRSDFEDYMNFMKTPLDPIDSELYTKQTEISETWDGHDMCFEFWNYEEEVSMLLGKDGIIRGPCSCTAIIDYSDRGLGVKIEGLGRWWGRGSISADGSYLGTEDFKDACKTFRFVD